jgi:biopolymer transport protein ExbB/TolQ
MLFSCPHCQTSLDVAPEHAGQNVQCPACGGKLKIPKFDSNSGNSKSQERKGWEEKDHANVNFLMSLLIGTGISAAFLAMMIPFRGGIGSLFLDRGWVNYAETFFFFWGIVILAMKWRMIQHQKRAVMLDLFPKKLGREINIETVSQFIDNVYKVPLTLRDSLIVNRIRKALELFESRPDNGEVTTFLGAQSDVDANRSAGSYSLVKVFLWAIPILGFIGTVQGLSVAVASLSMGDNANPDALKQSINSLTGGLGVAFDTTLLGLVLSMFMSFPLAAVRKEEDETLTMIDVFCTEKLLPRLNDSKRAASEELIEQADSLPGLVTSLAKAHETFLINLNDATRQLHDSSETLNTRLAAHQQTVEATFAHAVKKLSDTSNEIFLRSGTELNSTFQKIATGIELINKALGDLGQNKIPEVLPEPPPKRRFLGFLSRK